ncbi:MAG: DUF2851 family protein [Chitinophagaceae bacterium]|nr:DUF2851 family protein [Chitinophagaceae bacterium]
MTERLLHFIWQFQYFNKGELATTDGETVQVLFPGQYNTNQGPDFSDAKIRIGKTTWAGTVELHIKTTDWAKHNHQLDKNYNNVILHVVWEDDSGLKPTAIRYVPDKKLEPGTVVPILELKDRVSKILLQRYEEWMNSGSFIPCEKTIHRVGELTWNSWKDRLLIERLLRKARIIENYLTHNKHHWEEIFWWMLSRNFGMKVNADAFEAMAKSIPISVLAKHKNQLHQVEALLLGQAGLLEGKFTDDYPVMLQKEYKFYKNKYQLKPTNSTVFFLRMRPGNFPTSRLAQLAMLVHQSTHLFSKIKEANSIKDIKEWFDVTANDYWHYHYRFDETASFKKKTLGAAIIDNIIINTVAPFLFAYGNYHNEHTYKEKALKWLEKISAENNHITKGFQKLGAKNINAIDSQSLLELKNEYCNTKRCLECGVGYVLLKT